MQNIGIQKICPILCRWVTGLFARPMPAVNSWTMILSSPDPEKQSAVARAIVEAVTHFDNPAELVRICQNVDVAMRGEDTAEIPEEKLLQSRGW